MSNTNYLNKNYIEGCQVNDTGCFLPHHAVIKQERTATKLRIYLMVPLEVSNLCHITNVCITDQFYLTILQECF